VEQCLCMRSFRQRDTRLQERLLDHQSSTRKLFVLKLARDHNKTHWILDVLLFFGHSINSVGYGESIQDK
jgi:hypothetical protein